MRNITYKYNVGDTVELKPKHYHWADVSLLLWLQDLELKLGTIYRRLSNPVVQQKED